MGSKNGDSREMIGESTDRKKSDAKKIGGKKSSHEKVRNHHSASERSAKQTLPPHRRRCIVIKDAKHRGEWTELIFMSRATERGFNVSKPWGDSSRYDCAVERGGRFLRVQVKSTIARAYGGYVVAIKSSRCQYYTRRQVDFFAVYLILEDVWYILPAQVVIGLRGHFLLAPRRHPQKYAAYKEAWHLLKAGVPQKISTRTAGPAPRLG